MDASVKPAPPQGSSIVVDEDGVFRWVFEYSLWRNPTILYTILKVIVGVCIALFVLFGIMDIVEGYTSSGEILDRLRFDGIILLVMLVLVFIGYAVYAIMNGGKYCVVFTMDEEGIVHKQLPRQFEKAQVIGALNVLVGAAAGNASQMGIGTITATHDATASSFANVKSIQGIRRRGVIKVNEPMAKNQVYVEPGDYDFVYGYIVEHCPDAEVRG